MRNLDYYKSNKGDEVYGYLLATGDTVQDTDVYNSSNGKWEPCPCPGLTIQLGASVKWVRPYKE